MLDMGLFGIGRAKDELIAHLKTEVAELRDERRALQAEIRHLIDRNMALTQPVALNVARMSPPPGGDPMPDVDVPVVPSLFGPTEHPDPPARRLFFPGRDRRPRPAAKSRALPAEVVPGEVTSE